MAETDENFDTEIEVSVDLVGIKTNIKAKTAGKDTQTTLSSLLDSLTNNIDKIKQIRASMGPAIKDSPLVEKAPLGISKSLQEEMMVGFDDPVQKIADDLGTTPEIVNKSKTVFFKSGIDKPQIVGASRFSPEYGALIILYSFEIGLGKHFVSYVEANDIYESCHYKTGSIAARTIPNLKQRELIDTKRYDASKELTLSPKGLDVARKLFKKELGID